MLDGAEPRVTSEVRRAAEHVSGMKLTDACVSLNIGSK